jgi:hypothetical protein
MGVFMLSDEEKYVIKEYIRSSLNNHYDISCVVMDNTIFVRKLGDDTWQPFNIGSLIHLYYHEYYRLNREIKDKSYFLYRLGEFLAEQIYKQIGGVNETFQQTQKEEHILPEKG